jgi:hypothetical protein
MARTREQIEQQIWDYIDGLSTPDQKHLVERLLQTDPLWQQVYRECLALNAQVDDADWIQEPSLRFNRNLMEKLEGQRIAPPANSYINPRIIRAIAAFFILSISGILIYAFSSVNFTSTAKDISGAINTDKYLDTFSNIMTSPLMYVFLFMDVIVGLLFLDNYLRRRQTTQA